ncbi:MAG TPA: preprotein translocase subunit YajC [Bacteroidales bacterium]|nr:preprotein translocase subunit YajC [Bacteroidales bacterium]HPE57199.1 preprotein translocase subunit YajC [Bacteroidales bacterium]HRX97698.1 preprotein translocase subunit YajC [Bacteroidales bacterium]
MKLPEILLFMQPAEGQEGGGIMSFLPLVLIVLVFYLFFIRPQMKKSKDQKKFREALKKGDKIITIGGIHGKIIEVQEKTFTIEVEGQNRLKIERSAVSMDGGSQIGENK